MRRRSLTATTDLHVKVRSKRLKSHTYTAPIPSRLCPPSPTNTHTHCETPKQTLARISVVTNSFHAFREPVAILYGLMAVAKEIVPCHITTRNSVSLDVLRSDSTLENPRLLQQGSLCNLEG